MNFDVPLFHGITVVGTDDLNYRISTGGDIDESQTKSLPKDAHENNGESYLNILEPITPTKEKQGLVCQVNGLYHNKQSDTYQDALAILKIIVQQGLSRDIYVYKNLEPSSSKNILDWLGREEGIKRIPVYYGYILDEEFSSTSKEALSNNISCFLDKLEINVENEKFKQDKEEYFSFLGRLQALYEHVIYKEKERFQSIFSAIEWCFDSYSIEEESETLSFLNVCFGLESLFTSTNEDKKKKDIEELRNISLSEKLSLKCAYLISQNFDEREKIIKSVKDIYSIRSSLVHGNKKHLTTDEIKLLRTSRAYLERSIIKELELRFIPI